MKTENTLPLQGDLEKFVKGELAIHVQNAEEYVGLISQLEKSDVRLSNAAEYQKNREYYDPQYQYYYMDDPNDLHMNANVKIENLMQYYNINEFVKYSALDFVKSENNYYVTFGSNKQFPYPNQYLVIKAPGEVEAQKLFRMFYPDRHENTLNYSFMYSEEEWKKLQSDMKCAGGIEVSNGLATVMTIDRYESKLYQNPIEVTTSSKNFEAALDAINDRVIDLRKLAGCTLGDELAEEINSCLRELSDIYSEISHNGENCKDAEELEELE